MHRVQSLADLPEGLPQTLLESGCEALVDRLAHLLQSGRVLLLHLLEAAVDGGAKLVHPFLVGIGERRKLGCEHLELALLLQAQLPDAAHGGITPVLDRSGGLLARSLGVSARLFADPVHLLPQQPLTAFLRLRKLFQLPRRGVVTTAQEKHDEQPDGDEQKQHRDSGQSRQHALPPRTGRVWMRSDTNVARGPDGSRRRAAPARLSGQVVERPGGGLGGTAVLRGIDRGPVRDHPSTTACRTSPVLVAASPVAADPPPEEDLTRSLAKYA